MILVADSSALVALALCDGLVLLDALFDEVKVPRSVLDEVIVEGKPAARKLESYLVDKMIDVEVDSPIWTPSGLGKGELDAMNLCKSVHADFFLVDDRRARKVARLNDIAITGSLGILLLAKHNRLIPKVKPFLDRLKTSDIRISESIAREIMALAQECQ